MKKILFSFTCLTLAGTAYCQVKAKPKTSTGTTAAAPVFKNTVDSFSYAIAMSTAAFFKDKGCTQVNTAMVTKAFDDVFKKDKTALTNEQMQQVIMTQMQKLEKDKTAVVRKQGEAFLAANKQKPGVVSLPSGLQYQVLKAGTGAKPTLNDTVKVHYHGTLIDGTVFDSSVDRGEPITLPVSGVIAGWTEALQLMPVGSKWKLFIPADLAYGDRNAGDKIKGGSTLIFDVELLGIEHKTADQPAANTPASNQ